MRLIDADKIYPWYLEMFSAETVGKEREIKPDEVRFSMNDIRDNLDNIATEKEPKTGRWIEHDIHNYHTDFKCSECGYIHSFTHPFGKPSAYYAYCPNCGAKMEREAKQ